MHITIQSDVFVIIGLTILLCIAMILISKAVDKADPLAKPKGVVLLIVSLCEMIDKQVSDNVGNSVAKKLSPYVVSIAIYIFISNILGLFGFASPTANYSVTLTLTAITWTLTQITQLKFSGFKAYMHAFIEPIVVFLPMNIFGKFSSLVSMSLRLFGNILCGSIIMQLVYSFCNYLSGAIVGLLSTALNFAIPFGGNVFNFVGPILAPILHCYFDIFAGFIQTLIFVTLTMVFIGNEIPEDMKKA